MLLSQCEQSCCHDKYMMFLSWQLQDVLVATSPRWCCCDDILLRCCVSCNRLEEGNTEPNPNGVHRVAQDLDGEWLTECAITSECMISRSSKHTKFQAIGPNTIISECCDQIINGIREKRSFQRCNWIVWWITSITAWMECYFMLVLCMDYGWFMTITPAVSQYFIMYWIQ